MGGRRRGGSFAVISGRIDDGLWKSTLMGTFFAGWCGCAGAEQ
eukprot:COSAG02_NODE_2077_length_9916_cov_9.422489_6_plen_43_part_00